MAGNPGYDERRHAELVEQLRRLNVGIEALHIVAERQARLLSEMRAEVGGAFEVTLRVWHELRRERGGRP